MNKTILTLVLVLTSLGIWAQNDKTEMAKDIIMSFKGGNYSNITKYFDHNLKSALPEEKLELAWKTVTQQVGPFMEFSDITIEKRNKLEVAYLLCYFKNGHLKLKATFNAQNKIMGLFFIPENQK